jgi:hypothetical protein
MRPCTLLLLSLCVGCATTSRPGDVALRSNGLPRPEECPTDALEAMKLLGIDFTEQANAEVDVEQAEAPPPVLIHEGPIASESNTPLGRLFIATLYYGKVWVSDDRVVIRYYEAQPNGKEKLPFCAVAVDEDGQLLRRLPESKPGTASLDTSSAFIRPVSRFP